MGLAAKLEAIARKYSQEDFERTEIARDFDEKPIGDGLPGEAGACRAEGDRNLMRVAVMDKPRYFFFAGTTALGISR